MNLFKGLEKFGLKTEGTENLFEEEKRTNASTEQGEACLLYTSPSPRD